MGGNSSKSGPKSELRIVILGLDNSGKTTILRKLANEDIQMIEPTQGFNAKSLPGPKGSRLVCFDVGGQQAIRGHWAQYFSNSQALVFVVDAADEKRLDEVGAELSLCLDDSKLSGVPVLIFANKQDLSTALKPQDICNRLKLWTIRDHTWEIKGCSALDGTGVKEGIDWVCQKIQK